MVWACGVVAIGTVLQVFGLQLVTVLTDVACLATVSNLGFLSHVYIFLFLGFGRCLAGPLGVVSFTVRGCFFLLYKQCCIPVLLPACFVL